jgi:peptidyl-prolyl cis-trans isomerase B (cyclophilin B)
MTEHVVRTPHSARSQFFINLVDNASLDHRGGDDGWGYAVFGRVIEGMDVVDVIAEMPTQTVGPYGDVPVDPVVIESAERGEDIQPGA